MALHAIEICAGVGMLGEGLRAGLAHLGLPLRTVCYVERESYAAGVLAARCEEGSLDQSPVWSDLLTFDAHAWRGAVDGIAAGFPCQDLSLAGKRAGLDGKRSGLFFDILDIADDSGAWFLFLENVAGIASATSTVVDEAAAADITGERYRPAGDALGEPDGAVLERAAARVVGELADRGWHAEWLTLSASDVGASHGRERWFCFAWRQLGNTECGRLQETGELWQGRWKSDLCGPSDKLGSPESQRRGETRQCDAQTDHARSGGAVAELADATGHGWHQGRAEPSREQGRPDAAERGCAVADTRSSRCERSELGRTLHGDRGGEEAHGPVEQLRRPFFAPGPSDPAWAGILQQWTELAPALEPTFYGEPDGMAFAMDENRAQRLKCCGNGVVALCAAAAFVQLARRAGLR